MTVTVLRGFFGAVREVFRPEHLEDLPARHIDPFRRGFFSYLFGRESLPKDEAPAGRPGPPLLAWLFGPEDLPEDLAGKPAAGRAPFLGTLFAGEDLPLDEKPAAPRRRSDAPRGRRAG